MSTDKQTTDQFAELTTALASLSAQVLIMKAQIEQLFKLVAEPGRLSIAKDVLAGYMGRPRLRTPDDATDEAHEALADSSLKQADVLIAKHRASAT